MKKILILTITVVIAAGTSFYFLYNYKQSTRNTIETLIKEKKLINILIAGVNRNKDNKYSFFALLTINPENNKLGITFIPPSYRIIINEDKKEYTRIDNIEFTSYNKIIVQMNLKRDLKLHVPYIIELYASDIQRVVDMIEGIELFILDQVKDLSYLDIGLNYLDGKKIMRYINSVEDNSIYLKYDRIMDIIATMYYNKVKYSALLSPEFIGELFYSIKTNLLPQEIYKIAEIIYKDGSLTAKILPGNLENNYYLIDDIAYKIYESEFLKKLIFQDSDETNTKIKILNGTNSPGLARKMRNSLIRDGLNVVEFGTSPYQKRKETIIIARKVEYSAAKKVSDIIGCNNIYHIIDNTLMENVVIIIGDDYK